MTDVPRYAGDVDGRCQREGIRAEIKFKRLCERHGWGVKLANFNDNYRDHIDCFIFVKVNNETKIYSVDVKAAKRISRRDRRGNFAKVQDTWHWVEWHHHGGGKGWIQGKANWIAFGMLDGSFLMVDRFRLKLYTEKRMEYRRYTYGKTAHDCKDGILWQRRGNKDSMTMFNTTTLYAIPGTWLLHSRS